MSNEINYEIDSCITDLDTLICLDKRAIKDLENNTHEIEQQEVLTIIREFIRLRNDYNKEKEKNKTVRDRIKYYLLDNMSLENNPEKLRKEFIRLKELLEERN